MRAEDFPTVVQMASQSRWKGTADRFAQALPLLAQGLADGAIANQDFIQAKDSVNRALERAWEAIEDQNRDLFNMYARERNGEKIDEKMMSLMGGVFYPQAHTMAGQLKKLEKLPNDRAVEIALKFWREVQPLGAAINALKDKVVKRQPKSEEEKRAERFTPPRASTKAAEQVHALLEEVVNMHFEALVTSFTTRYMRSLNDFMKAQKAAEGDKTKNEPRQSKPNGERDYESYYSLRWHCTVNKEEIERNYTEKRSVFNREKPMVAAGTVALLSHVMKPGWVNGYHSEYREMVDPDAPAKLAEKARKDADELRQMFIVKNLKKLVSIVEGKGDGQMVEAKVIDSTVRLDSLEGVFYFAFADGSSFTAKNSVVWSTSTLGKEFARFPLTFHGVKLAGGVNMGSPSEKRMNTVFLGKAA